VPPKETIVMSHIKFTKRLSFTFAVLSMAINTAMAQTQNMPIQAPEFKRLIASGAKVEKVAGDLGFTEGPVWHRDGYLLFTDIPNNKIMKWHPKEGISVYVERSNAANGLTFDKQGRLIACEHAARRVSARETNDNGTTLVDSFEGKKLNSPNDLAIAKDGSIYFTDPPYGLPKLTEGKELDFNGVYRLTSQGKLMLLVKDFGRPNGIAFSPDQKTLYIADTEKLHVRAFTVKSDGSITNDRIFGEMKPWAPDVKGGPDGMKVDVKGNVYVTGAGGVWVFNSKGKHLGVILTPEIPANCAFGDSDFKTLYITARKSLYRIRLTTPGVKHYGMTSSKQK
jgi:sugar lactone lactonase YvrE